MISRLFTRLPPPEGAVAGRMDGKAIKVETDADGSLETEEERRRCIIRALTAVLLRGASLLIADLIEAPVYLRRHFWPVMSNAVDVLRTDGSCGGGTEEPGGAGSVF